MPTNASGKVHAALAHATIREAQARDEVLAAIRECSLEDGDMQRESLDDLLRVAGHFQSLLREDTGWFLASPLPNPHRRDFAQGVQLAFLETANGLQRYLRCQDEWAIESDREELLPRVNGLAVRAVHGFAKWGRLLDPGARALPWGSLHALYLYAEDGEWERTTFALQPGGRTARTTVLASYLRALLLNLLDDGTLPGVQIEMADGLLQDWCAEYSLDVDRSRLHRFCVDVEAEAGLKPISGEAMGLGARYLDANAMKAQVAALRRRLRRSRGTGADAAAPPFPEEHWTALVARLALLQRSLAGLKEKRGEERALFRDQVVEVTLGFPNVVDRLRLPPAAAPPPAEAGDPPEAPAGEAGVLRWRVHDVSSKAYGLVARQDEAETVSVGALLGLRNQETGGWVVGSVVRKVDHEAGDVLVGIEVLGFYPVAAKLSRGATGDGAAIYLVGADKRGKLDALIVRPEDVCAAPSRLLQVAGTAYRIRMNRRIRKAAHWQMVRFGIEAAC